MEVANSVAHNKSKNKITTLEYGAEVETRIKTLTNRIESETSQFRISVTMGCNKIIGKRSRNKEIS